MFMLASTLTLAYISIDRCMCICHPRVRLLKAIHPGRIILAVWLVAIVFMLPYPIFCKRSTTSVTHSCDCTSAWPDKSHYTTFKFALVIVGLYIPFLTILFNYMQICIHLWGRRGEQSSIENDQSGKKKRSVKMMILSTSLFFMSWFPFTVLYLVRDMESGNKSTVV